MSHALRCLLAAGCLTLLALAGCSGEQTQPPNANAQANLPGDNNQTQPPQTPTPSEAPLPAQPAPGPAGDAAAWIAPYLTDDTQVVVLVDMRRLGALSQTASEIMQIVAPLAGLPDLSPVEVGAFVASLPSMQGGQAPSTAFVLRAKSPPTPQLQQEYLAAATKLLNLRQSAVAVDGNTLLVGTASLVESAKSKPSANASMATALQAAGEHALTMHLAFGAPQRAAMENNLAEAKRFMRDFGEPGESLPPNLLLGEMLANSRSSTTTVDLEPDLAVNVAFETENAEQLAKVQANAKQIIDSARQQLPDLSGLEGRPGGAGAIAFFKLLEDAVAQGKLAAENGTVQYRWQPSRQLLENFVAEAPAMIAEGRKSAQVTQRSNALKQVGIGLLLFADRENERLPWNIVSADGKPLMSWRVALLPVMEQGHIYQQLRLDEPWDSPHNAPLLKQVDPRLFAANPNTPDGHADLQAVIGKDFGFSPNEVRDGRGVVGIGSVTDGVSYTAFVVEVDPAKSVPWAKPEDFAWNPDQPTAGLGDPAEPFFLAVFGDARVQRISKQQDAETLRRMFGRNEGEAYDLDDVPGP